MTWCSELSATPGLAFARSAVRCRFVDRFVRLRVPSHVSRQRVSAPGASLPSAGSRCARFPGVAGTMKALRLPTLAAPGPSWVRARGPRRTLLRSCLAAALPVGRRPRPGRGPLVCRRPCSGSFPRGREWDLTGSQAIHPVPLPWSKTPAEPTIPHHGGLADAAPAPSTAKASALP